MQGHHGPSIRQCGCWAWHIGWHIVGVQKRWPPFPSLPVRSRPVSEGQGSMQHVPPDYPHLGILSNEAPYRLTGPSGSKSLATVPRIHLFVERIFMRAYWVPDTVPGEGNGGMRHSVGEGTERPPESPSTGRVRSCSLCCGGVCCGAGPVLGLGHS